MTPTEHDAAIDALALVAFQAVAGERWRDLRDSLDHEQWAALRGHLRRALAELEEVAR